MQPVAGLEGLSGGLGTVGAVNRREQYDRRSWQLLKQPRPARFIEALQLGLAAQARRPKPAGLSRYQQARHGGVAEERGKQATCDSWALLFQTMRWT